MNLDDVTKKSLGVSAFQNLVRFRFAKLKKELIGGTWKSPKFQKQDRYFPNPGSYINIYVYIYISPKNIPKYHPKTGNCLNFNISFGVIFPLYFCYTHGFWTFTHFLGDLQLHPQHIVVTSCKGSNNFGSLARAQQMTQQLRLLE